MSSYQAKEQFSLFEASSIATKSETQVLPVKNLLFEAIDAFFSGEVQQALDAMQAYFLEGGNARPLISALQAKNRLLIQIKVLLDSKELQLINGKLIGLSTANKQYSVYFDTAQEKSSYCMFSQKDWYLNKLGATATRLSLDKLITQQQAFLTTFESIALTLDTQERLLEKLILECLSISASR